MSDDSEIDSPAFIRQRRNLIVAALVLAFAQVTHLTVHEFALFGIRANIDGPVSTLPYLWILWGYFLWRYWQAFVSNHTKPTKVRYREIKKMFIEPLAVQRALAQAGEKQAHGGLERKAWMPHEAETATTKGAKAVIVTNLTTQSASGAPVQVNVDVELTHADMWRLRSRALWSLMITSNEFSEYYLPFVVAIVPMAILVWQVANRY